MSQCAAVCACVRSLVCVRLLQAILDAALPHAWEGGRAATWMDIAHVEKTRTGHQRQSIKKQRQTKSNFFVKDAFGLRPHRDSEHVLNPNALVVHLRDGLEILHLYSGRPLCRLTLKAGEVHVDMDGDGVIDHVEAIGGLHQQAARARSGGPEHSMTLPKCLAVVHSGVPSSRQLFNASICQSSWADLMRFGGGNLLRPRDGAAPEAAHSAAADASLSASIGSAPVLSGARGGSNSFSVDSSEDGSTESRSSRLLGALLEGGQAELQQQVQVAHPIVIQEPRTAGKRAKKRRFHSFFFLNSGLVSSFNHDGTRTWHTPTKAQWNSGASTSAQSPLAAAFRPTLSAFSLRVDTPADHVLVIGERSAAVLSLSGHLRAEVALAADTVVAKATIGDFNNDHISDFVITTTKGYTKHETHTRAHTQHGDTHMHTHSTDSISAAAACACACVVLCIACVPSYYGYVVRRRVGSHLLWVVSAVLVLVLVIVFAFKLATDPAAFTAAAKWRTMHRHTNSNKSKATFTGSLRAMGKSVKAQL